MTCEELDSAIAEAETFVRDFVAAQNVARKLARKKPNNETLQPSTVAASLHRELRDAEQARFLLEQRIELLQNKLKAAIGDCAGISGVASWKWREQEFFDGARLKAERPDIYDLYKRPRGSRVFQLLRRGMTETAL